MRSKIDFYKQFFEQLARRGFQVRRSESSDYLADIYHKGQLVAFYTKGDTIEEKVTFGVGRERPYEREGRE